MLFEGVLRSLWIMKKRRGVLSVPKRWTGRTSSWSLANVVIRFVFIVVPFSFSFGIMCHKFMLICLLILSYLIEQDQAFDILFLLYFRSGGIIRLCVIVFLTCLISLLVFNLFVTLVVFNIYLTFLGVFLKWWNHWIVCHIFCIMFDISCCS